MTVKATDDVAIAVDQNQELFFEPGYELWDVRLAYEWPMPNEDLLIIEVIGKNVTDEEYRQQRLFLGNGLFQGWGPPETWAISLAYRH